MNRYQKKTDRSLLMSYVFGDEPEDFKDLDSEIRARGLFDQAAKSYDVIETVGVAIIVKALADAKKKGGS